MLILDPEVLQNWTSFLQAAGFFSFRLQRPLWRHLK